MNLLIFLLFSLRVSVGIQEVIELTPNEVQSHAKHNANTVILQYSPWCPYSTAFLPRFSEIADFYQVFSPKLNLNFAKVDVTHTDDFILHIALQTLLTIQIMINSKVYTYTSTLDPPKIIMWISQILQQPIELKTEDELTHVLGNLIYPVLLVKTNDIVSYKNTVLRSNDHTMIIMLLNFPNQTNSYEILRAKHYAPEDKHLFISSAFTLLLNPHYLQADPEYDSPSHIFQLGNQILDNNESMVKYSSIFSFAAVTRFDPTTFNNLFSEKRLLWIILLDDEDRKKNNQLILEQSRILANSHRDKLVVIQADLSGFHGRRLARLLSAEASDIPVIFLTDMSGIRNDQGHIIRYRYLLDKESDITSESFALFVKNSMDGKIPQYFMSEAQPLDEKGPVYTLTAQTYHKEINEAPYSVLLNVYAPWCGHCKKLDPIYEEVAYELLGFKDNLKVMRIDSTANEVNLHIVGYPTIILFVKNDKKQKKLVYYTRERSVKALTQWVIHQAELDIKAPDIIAQHSHYRSYLYDEL